MFLFKSEEERKADRLKELTYENTPEYTFNGKMFLAKVLDIYDGDTITITVKIDGEYSRMNCRLNGIDTPELKSSDIEEKAAAKISRKHLMFLLTGKKIGNEITRDEMKKLCGDTNAIVKVKCFEFDKYGRLLVEIWVNGICINEKMIEDGFAGPYDGGTKSDWKLLYRH